MLKFLTSVLELIGIVYLRFKIVPRIWCVWLVGINLASLFYIGHIEAQVVFAAAGFGVVTQAFVYQKMGFTRVLGLAHIVWVPMFFWMATRVDSIPGEPGFSTWIMLLVASNIISLIIDTIDVTRFIKGERAPHYTWERASTS